MKRRKRHLRPSIKMALEIIAGSVLVFAMVIGLFMNHATQLERSNDIDYVTTKAN